MAQRFSGQHSPDNGGPLVNVQPQKGRARARLLYLAAIPLLFTGFGDGAVELASTLAAFGAIVAATYLTNEGLEAEDAYNARTVARRPAVPRKLIGSVLLGLGVALATFGNGPLEALLYGLVGAGLHIASFGMDPVKNKVIAGVDTFQTDRVARAVDEAENHLRAMTDSVAELKDRVLKARVETFQQTARAMFRGVENDPRELTGARRYLGVYLLGARDATTKFVDLYMRQRDEATKTDYLALLDDLEANFAARTQNLIENKSADLEIEISVLRDRLGREGVKINQRD